MRDQFTRAAEKGPTSAGKITIGEVSADDAARINAALRANGVDADVSGYRHEADAYSARHAFTQHGDAAREAARGQEAVTAEDWAKLPEILAAPDKIEYVGRTKTTGLHAIAVSKQMNGETFVIQEVRTGRKTLAVTTMYKSRAAVGRRRDDRCPPKGTPLFTSETTPAPEI